MLGLLVVLGLWALACTTWHVFAQDDAAGANATDDLAQDWLADTAYEDTLDEFAYGGDGLDLFDNNYYQDEMQEYYDHSGTYSDAFGEDYFFDDVPPASAECTETDAGKANLTAQACDVRISGVDKLADKLKGGIDGSYEISGCYDGWPKYIRKDKQGARTLFFSTFFKDWDICDGAEVNATKLLVFGGDTMTYSRPNFVPKEKWHLNSDYMSSQAGAEALTTFPSINMTIECASGKALTAPEPPSISTQPLLTDDEADAKYRAIYSQAKVASQTPPSVNFFMVMTVLLAGMGVVMGLPYLLFKKKDAVGKSWAQQLEDSRKRRVGHVQ